MNKIAGFYARVSTGRQEKEETIDSQVEDIKERIKKDGNILSEKHQFADDGWSGDLLARPALDAMRDAASRKEFEVLYVWDRDRIARKYSYQELVIDELEELGIEVVDLHTAPIRNAEDKILLGFKGLFAEYEKIKIAERMRRGKLYKARSGNIVHGINKYGWTYVYKTKEEDCHYVINEKQKEIVNQIFQLIAFEHLTIRQLIKQLYKLGVPSPEGNIKWSNSTLSRLLRDEAYIGTTYYNRRYAIIPKNPLKIEKYKKHKKSSRAFRSKDEWIPIPIPVIVDKQLFDRVQKQLEINALYARRNKKHDYLLSHKILCECGSRMFGEGSGTQFYYRCTDRLKTYPLPKQCQGGGLNIKRIETVVWDQLQKLINNPSLIQEQAKEWLLKENISAPLRLNNEKEKLQAELQQLDNQEKRYIKAYGEGLIPIESIRSPMESIKKRRSELLEKLQTMPAHDTIRKIPLPSLDELEHRLPSLLQRLLKEDKQTIIRSIVKEIVVNKERSFAKIQGHFPLQIEDIKEKPKYGLESISRYHWFTKRRQIYSF